jgi:NADPH:quinone reductase
MLTQRWRTGASLHEMTLACGWSIIIPARLSKAGRILHFSCAGRSLMKAAYITTTGSPDVIAFGDVETPRPGPTDVLVKVHAAALNPIDTYIRSGAIAAPLNFPYIPGCDLAGAVEEVGHDVRNFKAGDRVWGSNQGLFGRQGTFAEYACVDQQWLYPTPENCSDEDAAAGALVGITAHLGLYLHAGLQPGEVVFVNGGTGGVGSAVVQFAKSASATVVATVGSEEKRQLCQSLGADLVLDYHSPSLDDDIRAFTDEHGGVDVWWETQREPTLERTIGMLRKRGRIVLMAGRDARPEFPLGAFYVNDLRMVGFAMFNASPAEQRVCAEEMNRRAEQRAWKPIIGQTMPLSAAAAAHRLQEENTLNKSGTLTGKIVVVP